MFLINFTHLNGIMQNEIAFSPDDCCHKVVQMIEFIQTDLIGSLRNNDIQENLPLISSYIQHFCTNGIEGNRENYLTDFFDTILLWTNDFRRTFTQLSGDFQETKLFQLKCTEYSQDLQSNVCFKKHWISVCH